MANLNTIFISGKLGADAELKYTPQGTALASFNVAVSESYGTGDQRKKHTEWFSCKLWGKYAEAVCDFMKKGSPVTVRGKIRTEKWQDQNGNEKSKHYLIADNVEIHQKIDRSGNSGNSEKPSNTTGETFTADDIPF